MLENSSEEEDAQFVRKQWIKDQMQQRLGDFTEQTPVKIFCGSYNLHAKHKLDDPTGFTEWLCPQGVAEADLYVLSFQEIIKLNAVNVAVDTKGDKICAHWEQTILSSLNSRCSSAERFAHVASKQLVGVFLCVFLRERLLPHCSDVRTAVTATGVMDIMGNKGGVVIRLKLYHSTLCFVGGHLAAKRDNIEGRNSDYRSITEKTCLYPSLARGNTNRLSESKAASAEDRPLLLQAADRLTPEYLRILDHDLVFWVGDLNYRIESSLSLEDVITKCNEGDIPFLRAHDQLNMERSAGNVFQGFEEGELNFLPTYKFIPGTDQYDNRPDKKLRPPAWCDRVLWRVRSSEHDSAKDFKPSPADAPAPSATTEPAVDLLSLGDVEVPPPVNDEGVKPSGLLTVAQELRSPVEVLRLEAEKSDQLHLTPPCDHYVRQLTYTSCMAPRISDHKPISALFDCGVRSLVKHKEVEIFMELLRILDKMENAGVPKLEVKGLDIDAGLQLFKVPHVSKVRLLNIGFSAVRWKFASKPGTRAICPPWIRVSPQMGMIAPGQAAEISVSVLFDSAAVKKIDNEVIKQISFLGLSEEVMRQLNAVPEQLFSDILILRVRNGRDFFVSVNASYKISGDDFAEISREDSDWQLETEEEPLEDKKKSQESSLMVDDEEDSDSSSRPVKKVDKLRAAATAAVSKMKEKAEVGRDGAKRKMSGISTFNIFDK